MIAEYVLISEFVNTNETPLYHLIVPPVQAEAVSNTDPPSQNVKGPLAVIVGAASGILIVTIDAALGNEVHPFCIQVTVYDPLAIILITEVVCPLDQSILPPVQAEEVKVSVLPTQIVNGPLEVIVGVEGIVQIVITAILSLATQPAALVTVTLYLPSLIAWKLGKVGFCKLLVKPFGPVQA
jgi:hypothetical protein